MLKNGYIKISAIVPNVKIADPIENAKNICKEINESNTNNNSNIFVTPELSLTGYTCADLFTQLQLYKELETAIQYIIDFSLNSDMESKMIVIGIPVRCDNQLFNCALYIQNGKLLALIPKTYIPNYEGEKHFSSAINRRSNAINICNQKVPFNQNILLKDKESELIIGTDIGEDLYAPISPSTLHCLNGANLILNLAAPQDIVGKSNYRRNLITTHSAKNYCGYVYVGAGPSESTADVVFSGHTIIAECGKILEINEHKEISTTSIIDIEKIQNYRIKDNLFTIKENNYQNNSIYVDFETGYENNKNKKIDPYPFVPANLELRKERCLNILNIQAQGLATRLNKTGIKKVVIGVSGGSDSTLALLVIKEAFEKNNLPMENVIGITMPGFGTSNKTLNNSLELMKEFGITQRNISIVPACTQHFKDIGQNENTFDITYENTQARERTQILFDVANKEGALVVGTGDLSELALGWCTYNGDHMSNYAVNAGVPKTLIKYLIQAVADRYKSYGNTKLQEILYDIIQTPISPELLPLNDKGEIDQKTESSIGKYDLHDFFLYNYIKNGFEYDKILDLAYIAFDFISKEEIDKTFETFIKRFTTQQFKRNCLPDGPKVGSISLSPRGDFKMPSDIIYRKR